MILTWEKVSRVINTCYKRCTNVQYIQLVLVEYISKPFLKVISSSIRNAKWPYLDLFSSLETFRHLRAVVMAGIIFLTLD
jgi:hypothetical protein